MTPYRIETARSKSLVPATADEQLRSYLDRLMKMIPGEVIALYLVGSGVIPSDENHLWLVGWSSLCLAAVGVIRIYGTADRITNRGPQWASIAISAVAFVVWLYSLGGPFIALGIHKPFVGSLLVLAWTFFVPIVYKGD